MKITKSNGVYTAHQVWPNGAETTAQGQTAREAMSKAASMIPACFGDISLLCREVSTVEDGKYYAYCDYHGDKDRAFLRIEERMHRPEIEGYGAIYDVYLSFSGSSADQNELNQALIMLRSCL